jgi:hypothetical protein
MGHPFDLLRIQGLQITFQMSARKQVKGNSTVFVLVLNGMKVFAGPDLYTQLFLHLPFQACFQGFTIFLFSAGKLPKPCQMLPLRALRDQYSIIPPQETRCYL